MTDHRYYVGPIGGLVALPDRANTVDASLTRIGGLHTSLSGARTLDSFGFRRSWTWQWDDLAPGQIAYVEALQYGLVPGPLRLLDPRRTNRLPEQVASGGSLRRSPDGFAATAGLLTYRAIPDVPAPPATLGPRTHLRGALQWDLPTAAGGVLTPYDVTTTDTAWRAPVLPDEALTLFGWVTGSRPCYLQWTEYTAAGAATTQSGPTTALSPATWTKLAVSFTPAAGTVAVAARLLAVNGSVAGVVHTTGWQLAADTAETLPPGTFVAGINDPDPAAGWRPGGGAPRVVPSTGNHTYSWPGLHSVGLTLLET